MRNGISVNIRCRRPTGIKYYLQDIKAVGICSKCIPVSACNETACNKTLVCFAILFITVKAYFSKDEPVPDKE